MPPADSASRARDMPEASSDWSSGTLAKHISPYPHMPTKEYLLRELTRCRRDNEALKKRLNISEHSAGIAAENYICDAVRGKRSEGKTEPFDVRTASKHRLEIKFAHLNTPDPGANTLRWTWRNALGNSRAKRYDRLILVGELDPRYMGDYEDPTPQYVIFDVPFASVGFLMRQSATINLTTNPNGQKGEVGKRLLSCQTSFRELRQRYGKKAK